METALPHSAIVSEFDTSGTAVRIGGCDVASIIPFVPRGVFDDATTGIMGKAFDAACKELHDEGQPVIVHEVMAKRIIAAVQKGERDVKRCRMSRWRDLMRAGGLGIEVRNAHLRGRNPNTIEPLLIDHPRHGRFS